MSVKQRIAAGQRELKQQGMKTDNKVAAGIVGTLKPYADKFQAWAKRKGEEMRVEGEKRKAHRSAVKEAYVTAKRKAQIHYAALRGKQEERLNYKKMMVARRNANPLRGANAVNFLSNPFFSPGHEQHESRESPAQERREHKGKKRNNFDDMMGF